jgi:hypothetical protein
MDFAKLGLKLRAEGLFTKMGRPFDKGAIYKTLNFRKYLGRSPPWEGLSRRASCDRAPGSVGLGARPAGIVRA